VLSAAQFRESRKIIKDGVFGQCSARFGVFVVFTVLALMGALRFAPLHGAREYPHSLERLWRATGSL
jgi:hypothetical protein